MENTKQATQYVIDAMNAGERLDVFATRQMNDLSRSYVQKLIEAGNITLNGKKVKANYHLQEGDHLLLELPPAEETSIRPENIPLDIVYEDHDLLVINKPRGMVVHPAAGNYQGTLVNALLGYATDLSGINGVLRPGIVHRLDKDTSGVILVAKNDRAHRHLALQIKNHTAGRRYLAIVHGNIAESEGVVHAPIGRDPVDRKKMAVVFTNGKDARTRFKVLERFGAYTYIQCELETGRTHQIRVHMTYIGHPVLGDPKYGPSKQQFTINGQALHAAQIHFVHPTTQQEMLFSAPLPSDMENILHVLRMQDAKGGKPICKI